MSETGLSLRCMGYMFRIMLRDMATVELMDAHGEF